MNLLETILNILTMTNHTSIMCIYEITRILISHEQDKQTKISRECE